MGKGNGTFLQRILISLTLLSSILIHKVSSEKILFLLPLSINSHKIFFEPLINALACKGHDVTVLTNARSRSLSANSTVRELVAMENEDFMKGYPEPFSNMKVGINGNRKMAFPFSFVIEGCHKLIKSHIFRGLIRESKEFDLIIVDSFLSGCLDGFIYTSEVPFILVTTMPAPSYISERVGNFLPPSVIPVLSFKGYEESNGEMGFLARLANFVHFGLARIYVNLVIIPSLEKVYREYLGDDIPGILEIESKASMIFMNSHFTMNFPRPLLPAVVEIGGMHCGKGARSKNSVLRKFISKQNSPHGFIYFSVGSIIDLNNAPVEFLQALMTTFSKLHQRVVLKWKMKDGIFSNRTRELVKIPDNVWMADWLEQQDLLAHENIRLFISHGGLLSLQEAVYYGVPVLGIPFGLDQDTNLHNAVLQGYAIKLDINGVTEEVLSSSINEILNNYRYQENAQVISSLFRQRPVSPLDIALFWTEYVISMHKQNTTHYIQSPARKMSIFQFYSCDILLFLSVVLVVIIYLAVLAIRRSLAGTRNLLIILKGLVISYRSYHHMKVE